ncbi:hypothetical protein OHC33_005743 [Knufia fluminis]|uniref:Reverse transcriptase n=1 Tax=Knufia fluminis TaxID=191047 RepID=A0AAN8EPG7_9EURO|nr:hypothetical protein OHC33_005743 [Knufia fluminis]
MASSGSVFSQTLEEITTTKLEELAKKRTSFEQRKAAAIEEANSKHDALDKLTALVDGVKACFSVAMKDGKVVRGSSTNAKLETDLRNLNRFMSQARFDPSVSEKIIQQWKATLLKHLEAQSMKYQYADLYGKLTVEWLTASGKAPLRQPKTSNTKDTDVSDDFEEVSAKAKLEARQKWEQTIFEEATVDEAAIRGYLEKSFGGKETQKAIENLRQTVSNIEKTLAGSNQFNGRTLRWVIKGLLASDLLTNEKRQVLRDFQSNDVILTELADVLNMRMASLDSWSWGSEVPVEARRRLNGTYDMQIHEDLLQAIFLQYIGVQWSVKIKAALMRFQGDANIWKGGRRELSPLDRQRRSWYMCQDRSDLSVQQVRWLFYRAGYFVSKLLNDVDQDLEVEEGDEEADFKRSAKQSSAKRKQARTVMRSRAFVEEEAEADEDDDMIEYSDEDQGFGLFDDGAEALTDVSIRYRPKNPMDAKQRLLHLLSTETLVKTRLHNEVSAFRSQYDSWLPSLPHATIITILAFFGFSEHWLRFFTTFLEAPLKFTNEEGPPRIRKRGTPASHILSDFLGEMVLFCLDYTVNQESDGEVLWRTQDDIWFWSASHEQCVQIWKVVQQFNETMGVSLNEAKSAAVRMRREEGKIMPAKLDESLPDGEIRWGMLFLDDTIGRFTIDSGMVDKHIEELRKQLKDKERSIFAWVQAYSTYASVFFTSNFGKPANCFGRQHIDLMLSMHERIQKILFSTSGNDGVASVVDWLKSQIEVRFGVKDVPDGYLFFPMALGGLDVKSPFISLLQLRESVTANPEALLAEFEEAEQEQYESCQKRYFAKKAWEYPKGEKDYRPEDPRQFMPFEEYIKFREDINYGYTHQLADVYQKLLQRPEEEPLEIESSSELDNALAHIRTAQGQPITITKWNQMDPYWKWVTMLYGPEMMQKFEDLGIVDPGLLPMGMVSLFKSGRVNWQE